MSLSPFGQRHGCILAIMAKPSSSPELAKPDIPSLANLAKVATMHKIKELLASRGMTQTQLAEQLGVNAVTISRVMNGHRRLSTPWISKISRALGVSESELFSGPQTSRRVMVRGAVQAGVWNDRSEWPESDWFDVSVPDGPALAGAPVYGLVVRGDSMNRVYPDGTVIIVRREVTPIEELVNGKRYHVEIQRPDGRVESTVKTFRRTGDGRRFFMPESDDPEHQSPIAVTAMAPDHIAIAGRVVYSLRSE